MPRVGRGNAAKAAATPAGKLKRCLEALVQDPEAACLGGNEFCCSGCGGNSDMVDSLCTFVLHSDAARQFFAENGGPGALLLAGRSPHEKTALAALQLVQCLSTTRTGVSMLQSQPALLALVCELALDRDDDREGTQHAALSMLTDWAVDSDQQLHIWMQRHALAASAQLAQCSGTLQLPPSLNQTHAQDKDADLARPSLLVDIAVQGLHHPTLALRKAAAALLAAAATAIPPAAAASPLMQAPPTQAPAAAAASAVQPPFTPSALQACRLVVLQVQQLLEEEAAACRLPRFEAYAAQCLSGRTSSSSSSSSRRWQQKQQQQPGLQHQQQQDMELPLVEDPQAFLDFQSSLEHQTCVCQALLFTVSELASHGPRGLLMLQQADCMPLVLQLFRHAWRVFGSDPLRQGCGPTPHCPSPAAPVLATPNGVCGTGSGWGVGWQQAVGQTAPGSARGEVPGASFDAAFAFLQGHQVRELALDTLTLVLSKPGGLALLLPQPPGQGPPSGPTPSSTPWAGDPAFNPGRVTPLTPSVHKNSVGGCDRGGRGGDQMQAREAAALQLLLDMVWQLLQRQSAGHVRAALTILGHTVFEMPAPAVTRPLPAGAADGAAVGPRAAAMGPGAAGGELGEGREATRVCIAGLLAASSVSDADASPGWGFDSSQGSGLAHQPTPHAGAGTASTGTVIGAPSLTTVTPGGGKAGPPPSAAGGSTASGGQGAQPSPGLGAAPGTAAGPTAPTATSPSAELQPATLPGHPSPAAGPRAPPPCPAVYAEWLQLLVEVFDSCWLSEMGQALPPAHQVAPVSSSSSSSSSMTAGLAAAGSAPQEARAGARPAAGAGAASGGGATAAAGNPPGGPAQQWAWSHFSSPSPSPPPPLPLKAGLAALCDVPDPSAASVTLHAGATSTSKAASVSASTTATFPAVSAVVALPTAAAVSGLPGAVAAPPHANRPALLDLGLGYRVLVQVLSAWRQQLVSSCPALLACLQGTAWHARASIALQHPRPPVAAVAKRLLQAAAVMGLSPASPSPPLPPPHPPSQPPPHGLPPQPPQPPVHPMPLARGTAYTDQIPNSQLGEAAAAGTTAAVTQGTSIAPAPGRVTTAVAQPPLAGIYPDGIAPVPGSQPAGPNPVPDVDALGQQLAAANLVNQCGGPDMLPAPAARVAGAAPRAGAMGSGAAGAGTGAGAQPASRLRHLGAGPALAAEAWLDLELMNDITRDDLVSGAGAEEAVCEAGPGAVEGEGLGSGAQGLPREGEAAWCTGLSGVEEDCRAPGGRNSLEGLVLESLGSDIQELLQSFLCEEGSSGVVPPYHNAQPYDGLVPKLDAAAVPAVAFPGRQQSARNLPADALSKSDSALFGSWHHQIIGEEDGEEEVLLDALTLLPDLDAVAKAVCTKYDEPLRIMPGTFRPPPGGWAAGSLLQDC